MRTEIQLTTVLRPALVCATALLAWGLDTQEADEEHKVRKPIPSADVIAKLPADGGPEFNRLIHEQSPYLLQHARNPVDWYPWGTEAFETARREDKPVFLSVGYSTCHWCHVMEHESFEDEEVAALMNAAFICVKVDREERPDIDQVYMAVTQAMTGRGGWPMTVLMTPEKKPFFAGTYFPKIGRGGRGGMMELIPAIDKAWNEQREAVLASAEQAVNTLAGMSLGTPGGSLGVATMETAYSELSGRFDAQNGGFGNAPKFPVPHNLRFLLRYAKRTGEAHALEMVEKTLHEMRKGGIWDHVGFGFHRYSTDRVWLLPHFEKMLYDQGLLAMACVEAWQVTGDLEYREMAEDIFTYVLRDMTDPGGGFYSAEDADSEGEEGLFYIWTADELEAVLGEADGKLATLVFGVEPGGNFIDQGSGEKVGGSILYFSKELAEYSSELGMEEAALVSRLESIRSKLFLERKKRIHPLKDDKVLTDWNGLMIAAFATAAKAFDEPEYRKAAGRAADFMLGTLRREDGRLSKRFRGGEVGLPGMLEDYAFAVWGLIETYEATFEERYLEASLALTEDMIAHFHDGERGGFFMAPDDGEALIVRSKEIYDGAIPSGNSVAALNLLRLARLTGETRYEELAEGTMKAFAGDVGRSPQSHTQLLLAVDFAAGPSHEVVISGVRGADDTRAMERALFREFVPNKVAVLRPTGEADAISKLVPYVKEQVALDGQATAYVCMNFACLAPTTSVETMLTALE